MTNILYIKASNDVNGNPRRGWLILHPESSPRFVDEGYAGSQALINAGYNYSHSLTEINVSASEYRRMRREYR